jgi:hypothetical protein
MWQHPVPAETYSPRAALPPYAPQVLFAGYHDPELMRKLRSGWHLSWRTSLGGDTSPSGRLQPSPVAYVVETAFRGRQEGAVSCGGLRSRASFRGRWHLSSGPSPATAERRGGAPFGGAPVLHRVDVGELLRRSPLRRTANAFGARARPQTDEIFSAGPTRTNTLTMAASPRCSTPCASSRCRSFLAEARSCSPTAWRRIRSG